MFPKTRLFVGAVILAAAVVLLTLIPRRSTARAQGFAGAPGAQPEGAWIGPVVVPATGSTFGFPFLAHFNRDGTWTSDDARAFGAVPPVFTKATTLTGSWVRAGDRKIAWRGVEILFGETAAVCGALPVPCYFLLVGQGSHEIAPGDPDHAINGTGNTSIYACTPTPGGAFPGFTCPSWDAIVSGAVPAVASFPPFTFTLTRIRAN